MVVLNQKAERARLCACVIVVGALVAASTVPAWGEPSRADKVKAATLFKLSKYVSWPSEAMSDKSEFTVGVIAGKDMFEALEEAFDGKTMVEKPVEVVAIENAEDLDDCDLVYFEEDYIEDEFVKRVSDKPVLTYGDGQEFAEDSGVIGLFERDNKIRFNINLKAARKVGLKISAKVLDLATQVHGTTG